MKWTFEGPRCVRGCCCHRRVRAPKARHYEDYYTALCSPHAWTWPTAAAGPSRGIPNSQFENWCSKYWLWFPKVPSTMGCYPGLTLRHSASDRWLNLLFVFLSPINDPGISRVIRLKEYRKCRTRLLPSIDKSRRTIYSWKFMVDG